ncbi:hypothetical protein [Fibrivirga algicola]|uniref:DUF4468 domain-containing protein n=1 Tax=Fibrivirga algicola TaxID=2950420 RepID=A0ABX0QNJ4_9BACT|nr:hypothetical protein [Fibrivirga algicola]NID11699.1 hypothetical protein [Fibrivirga algicola]
MFRCVDLLNVVASIAFLLASANSQAQNVIEWDEGYTLQFTDFQSKSTKIGQGTTYSLHSTAAMDFSFYMSAYEFMFTKNFNSKVKCTFTRDAAYIIAPDNSTAASLLTFARYEFDLQELYARKFRKRIFEEKGAFSSVNFLQPIYDSLQKELAERHANAGALSDIGIKETELQPLHAAVKQEISELAEFCKTCKPAKKKK